MSTELEKLFRSVIINDDGPGSILRDFETLLDFVGVAGLKTSGRHRLLPMSSLAELDNRMTCPMRPALSRPQQRSYHALHGLYLLLRSTGLGITGGVGSNVRLSIDPEMLEQWQRLNPTERYFNLLEAWLIVATGQIWGATETRWQSPFLMDVYRLTQRCLTNHSRVMPTGGFQFLHVDDKAHLALLELFGLAVLERQPPQPKESWHVLSGRLTNFGVGVIDTLDEMMASAEIVGRDWEDMSESLLQKHLKPHFPAWKENLRTPAPEFRDGLYQFKVSWCGTWRRISLPASCDLEDFAYAILAAYDFDDDHLYCFTFRDRCGATLTVEHPACDAGLFATEMAIGLAPIQIGETFEFLYDFGDEWQFQVTLERIDDGTPDSDEPQLLKSHGPSPRQYD